MPPTPPSLLHLLAVSTPSRTPIGAPERARAGARGRRHVLPLVFLALGALAGCAGKTPAWTVKPHQREFLADRIMRFDADAQAASADEHILANREGAMGGTGTSGGGCGCN